MTGALVSVDLDRTMIYSRNALGAAFEDAVSCVEIYQDAPLSFMSIDAAESLRSLAAAALVVPTTTRTIEQFQRIALPGAPWRYAIPSNGGNILVDGVPDQVVADVPKDRVELDETVVLNAEVRLHRYRTASDTTRAEHPRGR